MLEVEKRSFIENKGTLQIDRIGGQSHSFDIYFNGKIRKETMN